MFSIMTKTACEQLNLWRTRVLSQLDIGFGDWDRLD
jgi:hypothetical protein